jgi:hypothetical protein
MRRSLLLACLLASSLGCTRFAGPIAVRHMDRPDALMRDGQRYTIEEQQRRGRERLAITEDDFRIGPKGYIDRPSPTGR